MDRDEAGKKGIPLILKVIFVVLIIAGIVYVRRYYIGLQHPYKDYDILGTWDYDYSLAFDENENLIRSDEERFSLEMYIDTEIVFNDNGTFTLSLAGVDYSGIWTPDEHVSYLFHLSPESEEYDGLIYNNEIRNPGYVTIDVEKDAPSISSGSACFLIMDDSLKTREGEFWNYLKKEGFSAWSKYRYWGCGWVYVNVNSKLYAPGMPGVSITRCVVSKYPRNALSIEEFKMIWNILKEHEENT